MRTAEVCALVERVAAVDAQCAEWAVLQAAVGDLRRLRSWVEGREIALARSVTAVSSFPEKSLAEAGRTSLRDGERLVQRAETVATVPGLGVALDGGRVSAGHVDVWTRTLGQVEPVIRTQLLTGAERLVLLAGQQSVDEFGRALRAEARRLERDSDGMDRLERQRREVRFHSWVDTVTGMGRWSATWDPATMVVLEARLDTQLQALFHDTVPDGCPSDPLEKQSFLRAHALLTLVNGGGARSGRAEIIVVEDHTSKTAGGGREPVLDWGIDVDLPVAFLETLRPSAAVHTITVANGIVIDAPGDLDLGRTTRLANRAQRRALRALYATCAIPGCHVRYGRTKLHHVVWWRHGGCTDLANLLPVCEHHHQKIHHDDWTLTLGPNRELTITLPDGQIMTTGPPTRHAA